MMFHSQFIQRLTSARYSDCQPRFKSKPLSPNTKTNVSPPSTTYPTAPASSASQGRTKKHATTRTKQPSLTCPAISPPRKACATVSLSNANALSTTSPCLLASSTTSTTIAPTPTSRTSRTRTGRAPTSIALSQNLIPFPSLTPVSLDHSALECQPTTPSMEVDVFTADMDMDGEVDEDVDVLSFVFVQGGGCENESEPSDEEKKASFLAMRAETAWRIELRRRRSKSCLLLPSGTALATVTSSGGAGNDHHPHQLSNGRPRTRPNNNSGIQLPVTRAIAPRRPTSPRRTASVAKDGAKTKKKPVPNVPPGTSKRTKKSKKQAIDVHFVAMMHRSIARTLTNLQQQQQRLSESEQQQLESDVSEQDGLLVGRLWRNLLMQGFQPVPLEPDMKQGGPRVACPSPPPSFSPERDLSRSTKPPPRLIIPPSSLSSSPFLEDPTSSPTGADPFRPEILTMPQLIATLILRHNERNGTRPRSASAARKEIQQQQQQQEAGEAKPRKRSPLSATVSVANVRVH